ncbi:MAG: serine/threonine protein kinase, partial [Pseudolysinimonas sp.]
DVPTPDVRSDIFSLAATIHTVLAGRTPFEVPGGPNGTLDLVARIERGEVTPLQRDDVPPALSAVLAKGMSPRRENRYPTVIEFARALQRIELELGYAPTTIEVPVVDDEPTNQQAGGDETRVRSVQEVQAQPVVRTSASPRAARDDGQTRLAIPTLAGTATAVPIGSRPAVESFAPASRRRILITALVGGVAGLAIVGVVLAVVFGGASVRPPTTASPSSSGSSAIVGPSVPQAIDGGAQPSSDGTSVTFSWTNPDPKKGDGYYWARAETPADRQATPDTTATVTGVVPGSKVCINVEIGRSGSTGDPLVICTS